jgi:WD40 repeat protein
MAVSRQAGLSIRSIGWRRMMVSAEILFFLMDAMQIKQVKGHSGGVYDARYSPDSTKLATASADKTVKIWNTKATPTYR